MADRKTGRFLNGKLAPATLNRGTHLLLSLALLASLPCSAAAEAAPGALAAFNRYTGAVETRLARQHSTQTSFLAPAITSPDRAIQNQARLRQGEPMIERVVEPSVGQNLPGATIYHWRGTAFAPGAPAADFERLMKNFSAYSKYFSPQVLQSRVLGQQGDRYQTTMRVRQRHVITVVMDTAYDVRFGRLDPQHGYSLSHSTKIAEIDAAGTASERALGPGEEHGFLWRLNTYWSYEERDGGLYMQIESVSLTRSIPVGLGWAIGPFVESVPRESLEFTLRSTCNALRN